MIDCSQSKNGLNIDLQYKVPWSLWKLFLAFLFPKIVFKETHGTSTSSVNAVEHGLSQNVFYWVLCHLASCCRRVVCCARHAAESDTCAWATRWNWEKMRDERCEMGRAQKDNTKIYFFFQSAASSEIWNCMNRTIGRDGSSSMFKLDSAIWPNETPAETLPLTWLNCSWKQLKFIKSWILSLRHRCPTTISLWTHLNLSS